MSNKPALDDMAAVQALLVFAEPFEDKQAKWARVYGEALCEEVGRLRGELMVVRDNLDWSEAANHELRKAGEKITNEWGGCDRHLVICNRMEPRCSCGVNDLKNALIKTEAKQCAGNRPG